MKMQRLRNSLANLLVMRNPWFDENRTGILEVTVGVPEGQSIKEYSNLYANPLQRILDSVGLPAAVEFDCFYEYASYQDYLDEVPSCVPVMVVHLDLRRLLALLGGYGLAQMAAVWYLRTMLHSLGAVNITLTFREASANRACMFEQRSEVSEVLC